ncbi:MAG TPA: hypothetical protein VET23_14350 [Chitinophagaceae bacterium]|nr:hypothetical protein [Chitinophagaceae bacterium]
MKRVKTGFAVVALLIAIAASAFTLKNGSSHHKTDDPLYWFFVANQSTLTPGSFDDLQTEGDEIDLTGCDNVVSAHCRYGYTADQINFDNQGNPVSVKQVMPGVYETPTDIIRKHSND